MSDKSSSEAAGGSLASFVGLLTLLFIHHKLVGTIDWSWWRVLAPMWLLGCVLLVLVICIILYMVYID